MEFNTEHHLWKQDVQYYLDRAIWDLRHKLEPHDLRTDERLEAQSSINALQGIRMTLIGSPLGTCRECAGTGRKVYGSTAGRRGGVGGQVMTEDECDRCDGRGS
jgi:hypothetical protein